MTRMSMREFIRQNRAELDRLILKACPNLGRLNDEDRRDWIDNDEGLYLWARSEGVQS